MSLRTLSLTSDDCRLLATLCRNPASWGAGARGQGRSDSRCFTSRLDSGHWQHRWCFASEQAADRWNRDWEGIIAGDSDLHPGFEKLEIPDGAGHVLAIVVGVAGAILAEEVRAGAPYPEMTEGWSYAIDVSHEHHWSHYDWLKDTFTVTVVGDCCRDDYQVRWSMSAARSYPLDRVPRQLPALLTQRSWGPTTDFQR